MNLKKLIIYVLLLSALVVPFSCASHQYPPTEGPFRLSMQSEMRMFSFSAERDWTGYIFAQGVIPTTPVHVEGYVGPNLTIHWDGVLNPARRMVPVRVRFTVDDYCWAINKPRAMDDPVNRFWNREQPGGQQYNYDVDQSEGLDDPKIRLSFIFKEIIEAPDGQFEEGKILAKTYYDVLVTCYNCINKCARTY